MTTEIAADQNLPEDSHSDGGHGSKPSYDDVNTSVVILVGVVSTIVTMLTIWFVQGICYQWENSYIRERSYEYVNQPVKEIIEGQKAMLAGSEADQTISIEDSMKKVIAQYGSNENTSEGGDDH